jgi:hypothetical protein
MMLIQGHTTVVLLKNVLISTIPLEITYEAAEHEHG